MAMGYKEYLRAPLDNGLIPNYVLLCFMQATVYRYNTRFLSKITNDSNHNHSYPSNSVTLLFSDHVSTAYTRDTRYVYPLTRYKGVRHSAVFDFRLSYKSWVFEHPFKQNSLKHL
jgi:hypothetical protein